MKNTFRKASISAHILFALSFTGSKALGQGSFQNLGFEDAAYPLVPDSRGLVLASDAIPGWTPYIGGVAKNAVLYNTINLGTAAVGVIEDVFGTNQSLHVLNGSYSVIL